ncbi:uncharacterized protein LOC115709463 [Cannabis sativa]|uniref:Bifunctional inhibitor/plant lipid transfer protein/seed storage helical domain-containing protein n=1 Tax=Cannabis sativa TaxID=3483 RepID=A0A7J6DP57_CANSA|nr:uncharacterized protein LOC115709463 [Cannabis sativa]KAF4347630.1 hypothetical protein G4B88_024268 [Cannabis sativa]KAF4349987.1 hypothetical protein F8388_017565 [Cannabis sativa]
MARLSSNLMILAIWAVTTMLFMSKATEGCQGDLQGLITHCAIYVQKGTPMIKPSAPCCDAVRTVDIPCACQHITKEIEGLVDMNKVFNLASSCGRPLPHGTKCGSSTVP